MVKIVIKWLFDVLDIAYTHKEKYLWTKEIITQGADLTNLYMSV